MLITDHCLNSKQYIAESMFTVIIFNKYDAVLDDFIYCLKADYVAKN